MKNMNNNFIHLDNVSEEGKNRIIMYTTARQFKNAVPIEEMLIIPSEIGDWTNYCQITLNNIKLEDLISKYNLKDNSQVELNGHSLATARGKKIISKQTPFIVNKSFSCEIYLKLILLENKIDFKDLKGINGHKIFKLYFRTNSDFKSNLHYEMCLKKFTNIEDKIENISEAFINWRYIYEKYEKIDSLDFMFLDELCNYLDVKAKELILKNYNYDVNKDIR